MAELNTAARHKLAASMFGLPKERKYPMQDAPHAGNAKARARQQLNAGHITRAQYDQIVAKANRKLGPGHHSEPDADDRGGASDNDADDK